MATTRGNSAAISSMLERLNHPERRTVPHFSLPLDTKIFLYTARIRHCGRLSCLTPPIDDSCPIKHAGLMSEAL